ncbi:MAG: class I SAM-dependent methyltransferase [Actinomycetia bacterium]|nr:class I SAM-dependent methyltransferase [Actinomycetes bacterium]MCP4224242.1 class I SAM-dependent methyltransferase [Actinomycetes bacterium]MCP5031850.1 class I SAM-dependent methyltransferase [Actinomycetes bacterium]
MIEKSRWVQKTEQDPSHSTWYIERFRSKAAAGEDLGGEARFVNAMVAPGSRILDAGCGPGRVGAFLNDFGHQVVGVDVDPVLIAAAEEDHPGPTWLVGDLAELDLPARGIDEGFDVILSAGNVMAFLAASTRLMVLERLRDHLLPDGRIVVGFGAGRDYDFGEFENHVDKAGLMMELRLSTWDLRPSTADANFLVAVLIRRPS